ncbi:bacterial extracellular solute-binding s, 3 family protein [Paraburkholderia xenovorans LB400]|uniref:Amino acid ABC transporter substrate-binding protein, PAAT family n=1 Tax=Paraburkholderia xenovorans (strain LB400) TaxID=266265 RepID=Q13HY5_PARXL|nr:ABC transporter substrate-binding protein [Paraburkholderia xenovorans]ABE36304.1 amino acid ABC transporter substrate-binding protein, PAAT family [Paraburkholderia xenovorans LB400]AIP34702.1 bacterial extracellular solute-binding s, 3 family protein [Paraburkholderia xenovorans LB400]
MTPRRKFLANFAALSAVSMVWPAGRALADIRSFDFSPEQRGRLRAQKNPAAVRLLSNGYRFVEAGVLTVAVAPFAAPLASYATDARTIVGSDPDYAQLVADALGLKLAFVPVAWPDWPLGLASGKYDAVISNVGVTEQRKQKFDFTTYRLGLHAFYVPVVSAIQSIHEPKDISGLRIITGSGTIQERILLEWNKQNISHGLKEASLQYFDDLDSASLALLSNRADVIFNPHAPLAYAAATQGKIRLVGTVNAGWPLRADVAIASRKGAGLAQALTEATNGLIAGGRYQAALARWGLETEAIEHSETNPPGYKDA